MQRSRHRLYTLADVRRSYTDDKAWAEMSGDLFIYLLYRPPSFPVAWALLALGVPTLAVTLAGLLIALALPLCAMLDAPSGGIAVAALAVLFQVLDCVDGTMARTRRATSLFGAVVDGAVDSVFLVMFPLAAALIASREAHAASVHAVAIGVGSALLVLVGRITRDVLAVHAGARPHVAAARPARLGWADRFVIAFGGLEGLYPPALLVASTLGAVTHFVLAIAAYGAVVFVVSTALTLRKARALDRQASTS